MSLSERIRPNSEAAPWVIDEVARLERELSAAYLEMRKQRPAIKAVFDRDVWNRAESASHDSDTSILASHDVSAETLEKMRAFMVKQLAISFGDEPSIESFGAELENHLLTLIRAASVKMNAMGSLVSSMEARLEAQGVDKSKLTEARDTLQSERDANAALTNEVDALRAEIETIKSATTVTPESIGNVLTAIVSRSDAELLAMTREQLQAEWYWKWNGTASVDWNLYKFSDYLELHKRRCRRWEEHHNGNCCVVERVRDTYLMPRIKDFMALMKAHIGLGGK